MDQEADGYGEFGTKKMGLISVVRFYVDKLLHSLPNKHSAFVISADQIVLSSFPGYRTVVRRWLAEALLGERS